MNLFGCSFVHSCAFAFPKQVIEIKKKRKWLNCTVFDFIQFDLKCLLSFWLNYWLHVSWDLLQKWIIAKVTLSETVTWAWTWLCTQHLLLLIEWSIFTKKTHTFISNRYFYLVEVFLFNYNYCGFVDSHKILVLLIIPVNIKVLRILYGTSIKTMTQMQ